LKNSQTLLEEFRASLTNEALHFEKFQILLKEVRNSLVNEVLYLNKKRDALLSEVKCLTKEGFVFYREFLDKEKYPILYNALLRYIAKDVKEVKDVKDVVDEREVYLVSKVSDERLNLLLK
jgi:uncharacterized protein YbcC (UPF0753/DUF2309 family)